MARRKAGLGLGMLAAAGIGLWLLTRAKKPATAAKLEAAGVLTAGGQVVQSVPGVTVTSETGEPIPVPGENVASFADRSEAWGLQTGQMFPTFEGYGQPRRAWSERAMGPYTPAGMFYATMP